jgi:hypothetical protein
MHLNECCSSIARDYYKKTRTIDKNVLQETEIKIKKLMEGTYYNLLKENKSE